MMYPNQKKYYCRHCGKKYNTFMMAELCLKLDLKAFEHKENQKVHIINQNKLKHGKNS